MFRAGSNAQDRYHRGTMNDKYTYFLNICADVNKQSMNETSCDTKDSAMAFQITRENRYHAPSCYRLAGSIEEPGIVRAALLDPTNASLGFSLTMLGGEDCFKRTIKQNATGHNVTEWIKVSRSMTVEFLCSPGVGSEVPSTLLLLTVRSATTSPSAQAKTPLLLSASNAATPFPSHRNLDVLFRRHPSCLSFLSQSHSLLLFSSRL